MGFARRFGNSYAQHIMRQTMMYGAADLLHEDNRYPPSGHTSAMPRIAYAVESTFSRAQRQWQKGFLVFPHRQRFGRRIHFQELATTRQ